jgi:Holliday junction resolvase
MTPETKVKAKVHAALKLAGAYAVNYIGGQYATAGTPDILACLDGVFIGIEVKAGKNKPTALQIHALTQIDKAGGLALVINETNVSYLQVCLSNIRSHQPNLSNYTEFK